MPFIAVEIWKQRLPQSARNAARQPLYFMHIDLDIKEGERGGFKESNTADLISVFACNRIRFGYDLIPVMGH